MAINVACPCGRILKLMDNLAGKTVRCPECKQALSVMPHVAIAPVVGVMLDAPGESSRPNRQAPPPVAPAPVMAAVPPPPVRPVGAMVPPPPAAPSGVQPIVGQMLNEPSVPTATPSSEKPKKKKKKRRAQQEAGITVGGWLWIFAWSLMPFLFGIICFYALGEMEANPDGKDTRVPWFIAVGYHIGGRIGVLIVSLLVSIGVFAYLFVQSSDE
ncbi:MAG TPA: hypothetical protein PKD86_00065 [Gemmatales bacterium]|nr:hypothetical protein [Gemmatales bacterium]